MCQVSLYTWDHQQEGQQDNDNDKLAPPKVGVVINRKKQ